MALVLDEADDVTTIWTPADQAKELRRRAPNPLWVPGSAQPAHVCRMCGMKFTRADVEQERHIRHVRNCAIANEQKLAALVHHHNETLMERPAWADLEYEDWLAARARECEADGIPFTVEKHRPRRRPSD